MEWEWVYYCSLACVSYLRLVLLFMRVSSFWPVHLFLLAYFILSFFFCGLQRNMSVELLFTLEEQFSARTTLALANTVTRHVTEAFAARERGEADW